MANLEPTLADSQRRSMHGQRISSGRGWILFISIVQLVLGAIIVGINVATGPEDNSEMMATGIALLVIGVIYMGLWIWAKHNPFPAALTALILYVTMIAADAALSPSTAAHGIIIKIFVIIGLSKAVQSGYAARKQRQENPGL